MTFLSSAAKALNVKNLKTISARAEDEKKLFGTFDYVTARAVSSLRILLELAIPFLKVGGKFIAYKTDESELETSQNAEKRSTQSISKPNLSLWRTVKSARFWSLKRPRPPRNNILVNTALSRKNRCKAIFPTDDEKSN